jgi:hypothetical protein
MVLRPIPISSLVLWPLGKPQLENLRHIGLGRMIFLICLSALFYCFM